MNLLHEDLARAHMEARLAEARDRRLGEQFRRVRRLTRRAERANERLRQALARD